MSSKGSLIGRFASLLDKKFPCSERRELVISWLDHCLSGGRFQPVKPKPSEIPCIFAPSREFGFRDGFARDCLLQRGVWCEPDFLDHGWLRTR